jgi:sucrose phosphorylase
MTGATSKHKLKGVMFNAYPDSIGERLQGSLSFLERPELEGCFSLFYILPSFFHSDLDRGFSVIDYEPDEKLVSPSDIDRLKQRGIGLKFDLVLNHLSVASPQFQDLLKRGDESPYKDFFINWNEFWEGQGELGADGYIVPAKEHLDRLFTRKPGLPIMFVRFPDGSERPYWNTFYNKIGYEQIEAADLPAIASLESRQQEELVSQINEALSQGVKPRSLNLGKHQELLPELLSSIEQKRTYLGQMDLNADSPHVWEFYEEAFAKIRSYGGVLVRLDAFGYLHKEVGKTNLFNKPETWHYIERLKEMAEHHGLILLPEIHAEYGTHLHDEIASKGFHIYDFFLPGLLLHTIDTGKCDPLVRWINEIIHLDFPIVNMLGCHDGIPVLDLRGSKDSGKGAEGLLTDEEIEALIKRIMDRGGYMKNLYGPDGEKIAYYQVNATYLSALGEDPRKMRLARAVQLFMPGVPQVWYLDLLCGTNDHEAIKRGGVGGHKAINRTDLSLEEACDRLELPLVQEQIEMIRIRNTNPAFEGSLTLERPEPHKIVFKWKSGRNEATLEADFLTHSVAVVSRKEGQEELSLVFE